MSVVVGSSVETPTGVVIDTSVVTTSGSAVVGVGPDVATVEWVLVTPGDDVVTGQVTSGAEVVMVPVTIGREEVTGVMVLDGSAEPQYG